MKVCLTTTGDLLPRALQLVEETLKLLYAANMQDGVLRDAIMLRDKLRQEALKEEHNE
jgi:hypothetical protein